jgi:predicted nucleic acid-binding protein
MSKYLLDTDTLIDFSKGREPLRSRMLVLIGEGHELAICPINEAEFYAGLAPEKRLQSEEFFLALTYWPISQAAARAAGIVRYDFARSGKTLTITDCLVAAVAIEEGAIIMTSNTDDYPQPDVTTLSLREVG